MKLTELKHTSKKKKIILKQSKPLKDIEVQFKKFIRKMLRDIDKDFREDVIMDIPRSMFDHHPGSFTDANFVSVVKGLVSSLKKRINEKYNDHMIRKFVKGLYKRTSTRNKDKFNKSVKKEMGVSLEAILKTDGLNSFTTARELQSVDYIKKLRDETIASYSINTRQRIAAGTSLQQLYQSVKKETDMRLKRGDLLARNDLKNFNTELSNKRMENLGIERVRWHSVDDGRVRCTHRKLNGVEYNLKKGVTMKLLKELGISDAQTCSKTIKVTTSKGKATEHIRNSTEYFSKEMAANGGSMKAGQSINCRCYAEGIVEF